MTYNTSKSMAQNKFYDGTTSTTFKDLYMRDCWYSISLTTREAFLRNNGLSLKLKHVSKHYHGSCPYSIGRAS